MTRSELRARVRIDPALNDTDTLSDTDANTLLNEGALDMNLRAKLFVTSGTFNTVASQQTYVLSGGSPVLTNFLKLVEELGPFIYTESSGVIRTMPQNFSIVSEAWLDLHIPGWQTASASDKVLHVYLSHDSSGNLVLGQYPKPSTATPQWKVYFLARGTNMTGDTHYPWTGSTTILTYLEPYMKGIAYYALWQGHLLKTQDQKSVDLYLKLYLEQVELAKIAARKVWAGLVMGLRAEGSLAAHDTFGRN